MPTRRQRKVTDPGVLIERLPDEFRSFEGSGTDELGRHMDAVRAWIDRQAPNQPEVITPVMEAAGLGVATWFRVKFSQPTE